MRATSLNPPRAAGTNHSALCRSYIPMTEAENQRRMNEWRMKENALNGVHTTLTAGIAGALPSGSTTPVSPAIPGTPVRLAPRVTSSVASSMDEVDDIDNEDEDEDEDDDDDDDSASFRVDSI